MSDERIQISVLIPCYQGAHRLGETLAALATEAFPREHLEVIVADDGSPDPVPRNLGEDLPLEGIAANNTSPDPVSRNLGEDLPLEGIAADDTSPDPLPRNSGEDLPFPVRVVRLDSNRGRAAACNRALSEARGRIVLVLDDDMSAQGSLLAGHLAAHPEDEAPRAVIGRIDTDPEFFRGRFGTFLAEEERRRQAELESAEDALPFTHCLTGHFSIARETLQKVGGYCEAFSRYGFEDIELAWRLERAGVPLVFRGELRTRHRSEHASFHAHCLRHLDSGAMAFLFSRRAADPRVDAFLRIDGMQVFAQQGAFRKIVAFYHQLTRHTPPALLPILLWGARVKAIGLAGILPRRLRHVVYHVVRDMHYAAGLAQAAREKDVAP